MKQVIAVTGATGFIGRSLCRQLASLGYAPRALIRSRRNQTLRTIEGATVIEGSLSDQESLVRLVEGADAVIHCAGQVRGATQAQFDLVNVDGTRNVLRAIKTSGNTARLLLLSSITAREPRLSYYANSKFRTEQLLEQTSDGVPWTILRPPVVYGPGDREMLPLFRLIAHGIALAAGSPKARFSMIYVEDVSSAVIAWLGGDPVTEKIYTLDDGQIDGYDWYDLSRVVGEICSRKVRVMQAWPWLLNLAAWLNSRLAIVTGGLPMLTPEKLRELRHQDWVCNSTDFQQDFDWQPRYLLAEGLQATPGWHGQRVDDSTPGQ